MQTIVVKILLAKAGIKLTVALQINCKRNIVMNYIFLVSLVLNIK